MNKAIKFGIMAALAIVLTFDQCASTLFRPC